MFRRNPLLLFRDEDSRLLPNVGNQTRCSSLEGYGLNFHCLNLTQVAAIILDSGVDIPVKSVPRRLCRLTNCENVSAHVATTCLQWNCWQRTALSVSTTFRVQSHIFM
jgi:hypothetical protein